MVTTRKGENTTQEIRVDGKMLDDMNNFQHIGSDRIKRLQHNYVVPETFSHCDRIADISSAEVFLANIVPRGKCSFRGSVYNMCIDRQDGPHEFEGKLPLHRHPSLLKSRHRLS